MLSQHLQVNKTEKAKTLLRDSRIAEAYANEIQAKDGTNLKNLMESRKKTEIEVRSFEKDLEWIPGKRQDQINSTFKDNTVKRNPFLTNQQSKDEGALQKSKGISIEELRSITTKLRYLSDASIKKMDRHTINELKALNQAIEVVVNLNES